MNVKFIFKIFLIFVICIKINSNLIASFSSDQDESLWDKHFGYFMLQRKFSLPSLSFLSPTPEIEKMLSEAFKKKGFLQDPGDIEPSCRGKENDIIKNILEDIDIVIEYATSTMKHNNKEYFFQIRNNLFEKIHYFIKYRAYEAENFLQTLESFGYQKALDTQNRILNEYLERKDIQKSLKLIYERNPTLAKKGQDFFSNYVRPNVGAFSNVDIPFIEVGGSPYLQDLLDLIPLLHTITDWDILKEIFIEKQKKISFLNKIHNETYGLLKIYPYLQFISEIPLDFIGDYSPDQIINRYNKKVFQENGYMIEFSEPLTYGDVYEYIGKNFIYLGAAIDKFIPHNLRKAPNDIFKKHEKEDNSEIREQSLIKKTNFYTNIPFNVLVLIQKDLIENKKPFSSKVFQKIFSDIKNLKDEIYKLIKISLDNDIHEDVSFLPSFSNLKNFGKFSTDLLYIKKLIAVLESFKQLKKNSKSKDKREVEWLKYSILRTLVILGETSKEVSIPLLDKKFRKLAGATRDIILHPEKFYYTSRRLQEFLEKDCGINLNEFVNFFITLNILLKKDLPLLENSSLDEILEFYDSGTSLVPESYKILNQFKQCRPPCKMNQRSLIPPS